MPEKTLDDFFLNELKDIYFAEKQIVKTLPKLIKAAHALELKEAFTLHRQQTLGQIERLEAVFEMLDKPARGKTCEAIKGILEEGDEGLEDFGGTPVNDECLIASAQAVEHYEMARYGTLVSVAKKLGHNDAVALLKQTLDEETNTDKLLTRLASMKPANPAKVA